MSKNALAIKLDPKNKIPSNAKVVDAPSLLANKYTNKYTTGPFMLPQNTHSLNWNLLNNDSTVQNVRVTVFKCWIGSSKTVEPPGPLEISLNPGASSHNANSATGGFCYEIQVETNSKLVFPSVEAWPGSIGDVIPGTEIRAVQFVQQMR
ncbi:MAG: hypothetical protein QG670_2579 [Thermoproteota archaeon]|nr:hypothetical protein [Thermoproteota archaeon]